ncbi:hypothetical protein ONZ45_g18759 [Pleurotus djamor]|nr:hypothetical protein ONZ45_g18759 [Pleurotus djamor]
MSDAIASSATPPQLPRSSPTENSQHPKAPRLPWVTYHFPYATDEERANAHRFMELLEERNRDDRAVIRQLVEEITAEKLKKVHGHQYDKDIAAAAQAREAKEATPERPKDDSFVLSPELLGPQTPSPSKHRSKRRAVGSASPGSDGTPVLRARGSASKKAKKAILSPPPTTRVTRSATKAAREAGQRISLVEPSTPTASFLGEQSNSSVASPSAEAGRAAKPKTAGLMLFFLISLFDAEESVANDSEEVDKPQVRMEAMSSASPALENVIAKPVSAQKSAMQGVEQNIGVHRSASTKERSKAIDRTERPSKIPRLCSANFEGVKPGAAELPKQPAGKRKRGDDKENSTGETLRHFLLQILLKTEGDLR